LISLRWKLGGALLLVVLISVGLMAYLTNLNTTSQFEQYVQSGSQVFTQNLAANLEQYYARQKSWSGVQEVLNVSQRTSNDQLILANSSGKIIADTKNTLIGQSESTLGALSGTALSYSGQKIGTLYVQTPGMGMGKGNMGGRGMMSGTGQAVQTQAQNLETDFISRINNYLWVAGIIAILVALIVGVLLTRQFTRPIRALTLGAHKISEGDLSYRVKVHSNDELGKLAESFNSMAINLDKSEQSRKRLVSDVTHELRTPLTIIDGTVDGIMDGVFQPDKERLSTIKEQTVLLTHLVSDLRDLSLAESGQLKLQKQPTDLTDLVSRKLSQFEASAKVKNIQLKLDSQSGLPDINIDPRRIEQVITNLLSNAIRHTPPNGQIIVILKKSDSGYLLLSVADNGEGISAEHVPHIFERFYRVETSRARSEGGAGLGLAIVKNMVEAHGGQVKVESQPGKGSTFYVILPV
jgi:signal transduction histidine kinase